MKKLLILHGWLDTPDDHWFPYLKRVCQAKGYEVHVPLLKDHAKPTLSDWFGSVLDDFTLDSETSIVGHSLGAVFAMKLVENSNVKIDQLVLVSGWDAWDLTPEQATFFETLIDHEKIIKNCRKITVVHSTNDPYFTIYHAAEMAKRFNANFIKIENGGHLRKQDGFEEFPQLAALFNQENLEPLS